MFHLLASTRALFISTAILLTGHGLQLTLLPLRAGELGWAPELIGLTASSYFVGFVIGCLTIPRLVGRIGHIRTFAVLSAISASVLLLMGVFEFFPVWLLARCMTGWAVAGLYMVIESWLNDISSPLNRGTVLSFYAVITMLAILAGQFALGLPLGGNHSLFMLGALLLTLGLVPIGLTTSLVPRPIPAVRVRPMRLFRASQAAVLGAAFGGVVTGSFWGLGPVFATAHGLGINEIGLFMASTILGGAVLQLPLGRYSDRTDRRKVILLMSASCALLSLVVLVVHPSSGFWLYAIMFAFGGTSFPLYALCLAHANDHSKLEFIEIGSGILLANSLGSIVGPMLTAPLLNFSNFAMFYVALVVYGGFSLWIGLRILGHPVETGESRPFLDVPKTTLGAIELAVSEKAPD